MNYQRNDIRTLQLYELEILNEFVSVCDKNKLSYYLVYGTLLGAVRHKGFIPWDDDVDIAMPRADYELFCSKFYKELGGAYEFVSFQTNSQYKSYVPRIENKTVYVVDKHNNKTKAWIDIFPIDGMPEPNTINFHFHRIKLMTTLFKLNLARIGEGINYNNETRTTVERLIIMIIDTFHIGKIFSVQKQIYKLDRLLKKYNLKTSRYCVDFPGEKFKDFCPKDYYGDGKEIIFENKKYRAPDETVKLLTLLYGDYQQLPPLHKRNVHSFKSIITSPEEK